MTMGAPQSQARSGWYRLAALAALSPAFWLVRRRHGCATDPQLIASSSVTAERFALVNLTKSAPSNADITDASSAFVQALSNASGSYKIAIGSRNLCARLIAPPSARLIAPPSPDKVATAWSCQSWSTALQPPPDGPISVMATPAGPEGDSTDASADAEGDVTIYSVGPMEPPMNRLLRQVAHSLDGLQYALVTVPIAATFTGLAFGYLALSFIKTLNPSIALVAAAIAMSTSFVALCVRTRPNWLTVQPHLDRRLGRVFGRSLPGHLRSGGDLGLIRGLARQRPDRLDPLLHRRRAPLACLRPRTPRAADRSRAIDAHPVHRHRAAGQPSHLSAPPSQGPSSAGVRHQR